MPARHRARGRTGTATSAAPQLENHPVRMRRAGVQVAACRRDMGEPETRNFLQSRRTVTASTAHGQWPGIAGVDAAASAVECALEVMRSVLAQVGERAERTGEPDLHQAIAPVLVDVAGYDCVVIWRVDGAALAPVSVAFGTPRDPSARQYERLMSNPPLCNESGLGDLLGGADLAMTGCLGTGGPMEDVLGPLAYAAAAVRSRSNPPFVLQAMCCGRRADPFDRDLLVSIAHLIAAASAEVEASERPRHRPGQVRQSNQEIADGPPQGPPTSVTAGGQLDDALATRLKTLTSRERDVLAQALTGATYTAVADALFISVATVHSHMRSIMRKLGFHSRAQLIARHAERER